MYLSYNPSRNTVWTEHNKFPKGAVKYQNDLLARAERENWPSAPSYKDCLKIYKFSDDKETLTLIPKEDWEVQ